MQIGDIEAAQQKFTELGRIISEVSRQNQDSVLELVDAVSDGFDAVSNEVLQHDALAGTKIFAEDMRSSVTSVVSLFSGVTGAASSAFASLTESAQKAAEHLNEFEMPKQGRAPAAKEEEEKDSKLQKLFKKEGKAAASKFQGFARKLKIPLPGGVAAGGVGIMALGFLDEDRVRAEAGELKNVLESAYDAGIGNVLAKAVAADSKLQESLQNNYGISRKELQAVEAQFVRGGVGILQMGKKIGEQFAEDIPNTITTSALALDLMFNLSAGATAGTAVSYMHNYAMGLEESIGFIEKLSLSEAAHSLGAATLLKNIEDAASALSDYGFGIEGVADYAIQLQTVFEDMDVPDKYAGRMVGKGLTQISKGLSSMSDNWKMLIGERMSGQEGLDAIQWFEEAYTRVKREGSTQEYKDLVAAMYEIAHNATEGNEAQTYMMLSRTMGLGNLGATMTMKIGELNLAGDKSGALEATSEGKEVLKKAFQTKKEEKSQFQIQLNKWLKGLAKVGQGLISMVGKTLASLILYVRGWFYMIESIVSWDPERTQRIKEQVAAHAMDYTEDYILMAKGYVEMKNAGADVGAAFKNIVTALTTDVSGRDRRSNHGAGGGASGGWGTGSSATSSAPRGAVQADRSQPATKMQVVYIPTGFGSSGGSGFSGGESSREYDAGLSKKSARKSRRYAAKQGQSWAGGGLVLRSEGVSANGDIMMTVGGNCPRCGYIFGGAGVSSKPDRVGGPVAVRHARSGSKKSYGEGVRGAEMMSDVTDRTTSDRIASKLGSQGRGDMELSPELAGVIRGVSDHFGGQEVSIYKGLGAGEVSDDSSTGYHAHARGEALDMSVKGVAPKDLFKYLHSQGFGTEKGGLGYYPSGQKFVHVDVRKKPSLWVDESGPGEAYKPVKNPSKWLRNKGIIN